MFKKFWVIILLMLVSISACTFLGTSSQPDTEFRNSGMGPRAGMGPGSGMMDRHHSEVPETFAGLTNLIPADDESLARGEEIYITHCATCHGDYGNGDGPGGIALDPVPSPIAHTSQMMSDAYLFWRITEGGIPFETNMIPYRDILDENSRWDVINYVRALGQGSVQPGRHMGGQPFDPEQEARQRIEMLETAITAGLISQNDRDNFNLVHNAIDAYIQEDGVSGMGMGNRADALPGILEMLVQNGEISQRQADLFLSVHDQLIEAGLME